MIKRLRGQVFLFLDPIAGIVWNIFHENGLGGNEKVWFLTMFDTFKKR